MMMGEGEKNFIQDIWNSVKSFQTPNLSSLCCAKIYFLLPEHCSKTAVACLGNKDHPSSQYGATCFGTVHLWELLQVGKIKGNQAPAFKICLRAISDKALQILEIPETLKEKLKLKKRERWLGEMELEPWKVNWGCAETEEAKDERMVRESNGQRPRQRRECISGLDKLLKCHCKTAHLNSWGDVSYWTLLDNSSHAVRNEIIGDD